MDSRDCCGITEFRPLCGHGQCCELAKHRTYLLPKLDVGCPGVLGNACCGWTWIGRDGVCLGPRTRLPGRLPNRWLGCLTGHRSHDRANLRCNVFQSCCGATGGFRDLAVGW